MKRKTTKEILAGSFQELAQDKPVDKITIQDITDNCDYSPATFYRYFHDKYDLIAWDYVHKISAIMDKVGINEYQWKDTLKEGMDYFFKNKKYIQNLLKHTRPWCICLLYEPDQYQSAVQVLSEIIRKEKTG